MGYIEEVRLQKSEPTVIICICNVYNRDGECLLRGTNLFLK